MVLKKKKSKGNADISIAVANDIMAAIDNLAAMTKREFDKVDQRFKGVDQKFKGIDQRFDEMDQRFDEMDQKFDEMDQKINNLSEDNAREHGEIKIRLDNVAYRFELVALQKRVEVLEKRRG